MATYEVSGPNGESYDIEGPDDADPAAVISQITSTRPTEAALPSEPGASSKASADDLYDPADESHKKALRIGREVMRLIGQGATNLAEGVIGLPKMAADIPINAANLAGANIPTFSSQSLASAPELSPQNRSEEVGTAVTRSLGGTLTGVGTGQALQQAGPTAARIGKSLAANPAMQTTGAVTGAVSADIAREAGAGPVGQAVAGIAGGMAPGVLGAGAVAATRGAFRGGEAGRQTVEDNIRTFERAGTTPSVGQATESRVARAAENVLASAPGGAGPVTAKAISQADDLAANIETRAAQLVRKTSAEQAGRKIQQAVSGEGGFVDRFKAQQGELYDKLDKHIQPQTSVDVTRTQKALAALNSDIPNAPELSKFFKNAKIQGIERALESDALGPKPASGSFAIAQAEGQIRSGATSMLPYEAVKKLRTLVGNEMADAGLASDVPRSKWKALYAALSSDLEVAATASGPAGKSAWTRANNYTRAGLRRLETIDHVIDKNGGPEAVFRAATAGTKEGATTLRAVMQSVDAEGKKTISATVLRRMGTAKSGAQNELGDQFSTETFLTNWNGLSKEAKATLFDRYGPSYRSDMDAIAKTAANLREGSQVFRNPSGTAQKAVLFTTVGSFFTALGTGQVGVAGGIGAGVGAANLAGRLMTNPRFVRWLAQTTKAPQGAYVAAVNSLATQAKQTGDVDLARAVAILEQNQRDQAQQDKWRQQH